MPKVMVMLESKYLAIKAKMRAIETRLIIHSLLLWDKKVVRHLFRQRKYFNLPHTVENEDYRSANNAALLNNSTATNPINIVQLAEENKMEIEEAGEYPDLRHPLFKDEDRSISVIEMVKNAKEGQGKEFRLEDDIDQVADLNHAMVTGKLVLYINSILQETKVGHIYD
ncbi:hypothetical protein DH2020_047511 [Rehmannia glutinosa]|uniref:Uncharacterized protein n=1 Tax=Rehmannia glutinosa TaxID=99300 RepID=A0ABR0U8E2_REHGL